MSFNSNSGAFQVNKFRIDDYERVLLYRLKLIALIDKEGEMGINLNFGEISSGKQNDSENQTDSSYLEGFDEKFQGDTFQTQTCLEEVFESQKNN